jgi:hypothetical protein
LVHADRLAEKQIRSLHGILSRLQRFATDIGFEVPSIEPTTAARLYGGRVEERSLGPLGGARLGRIGLDEWLRRSRTRAA